MVSLGHYFSVLVGRIGDFIYSGQRDVVIWSPCLGQVGRPVVKSPTAAKRLTMSPPDGEVRKILIRWVWRGSYAASRRTQRAQDRLWVMNTHSGWPAGAAGLPPKTDELGCNLSQAPRA
jgi:hypothetical protein